MMSEPYLKVHQSRSRPPTDYENALADAIEACFRAGITSCEGLVAALNRSKRLSCDGQPWTVETFEQEMRKLGA